MKNLNLSVPWYAYRSKLAADAARDVIADLGAGVCVCSAALNEN